MEDKIITALDHLTVEQTERLLDENIGMKINSGKTRRIKGLVYQKAGLKRPRTYLFKKLTACAAVLVILLASFSLAGFDNVAAALGKIFSLIPGYGIVENNESIEYILSQPVSAENENIKFSLNNAIATKDSITVMFTLERKNYDNQQLLKDKQKDREQLQSGSSPSQPKVVLYAGQRKISEYRGYTGGGSKSYISNFAYKLKPEEISTDQTYTLEYTDYGLSLEFKLKNYDSYYSLEEIGTTGYHNDISITAVPTFLDGQVQVDLYAINKSAYRLNSFCKADQPYQNNDLHLETESGIKNYTPLEAYSGVNGKFLFNIDPGDKNFTLKVPYITVQSDEEKAIALKIPKEGEKDTVNQKVEFKDCIMTIVDVERTPPQYPGEYGNLKMTLQYDNKSEKKIMLHPEFVRADFWGNSQSGSWSAEMDENGVYTTMSYALEKNETDKLRLKVYNLHYCLTDEYVLNFSR